MEGAVPSGWKQKSVEIAHFLFVTQNDPAWLQQACAVAISPRGVKDHVFTQFALGELGRVTQRSCDVVPLYGSWRDEMTNVTAQGGDES